MIRTEINLSKEPFRQDDIFKMLTMLYSYRDFVIRLKSSLLQLKYEIKYKTILTSEDLIVIEVDNPVKPTIIRLTIPYGIPHKLQPKGIDNNVIISILDLLVAEINGKKNHLAEKVIKYRSRNIRFRKATWKQKKIKHI